MTARGSLDRNARVASVPPRPRARAPMPLAATGDAEIVSFSGLSDPREHVALVFGEADRRSCPPLVRLHSECLTGDVFGSARCDCGAQLDEARHRMALDGGIVCYLRQEGRGIGLYNKLDAYRLQDEGYDTLDANLALDLPADARTYGVAAEMLRALSVGAVRLLTNNPEKAAGLRSGGVEVVETVPTATYVNGHNRRYLHTKATRMSHRLEA